MGLLLPNEKRPLPFCFNTSSSSAASSTSSLFASKRSLRAKSPPSAVSSETESVRACPAPAKRKSKSSAGTTRFGVPVAGLGEDTLRDKVDACALGDGATYGDLGGECADAGDK